MTFILMLIIAILILMFRASFTQTLYPHKDTLPKVLLGVTVVSFIIIMITHPKIIFAGSVAGLNAWWNIVFPALLPFFIASELLMSFGVVHFMGVLLEPIMRPLFNIPGTGSFVMAIGFTSGYPIGSMVTARLRSQGLCSRVEAERLMSFTNNSSPLFMLVAVAVGMFNNPAVGLVIAGAHYTANLTLGLGLRFYGRSKKEEAVQPRTKIHLIPAKALAEMLGIVRQENRPFGKIMGDAVKNSINNLLNIGGFIILFAVIINVLTELGIIRLMAAALGKILIPAGVSASVLSAVASGFFEMTMGTKLASEASAPLLQQLVAVSFILAWSGLSVIAQVASMIAHTDIRLGLFIASRIFHAFLAGMYTVVFYHLFEPKINTSTVFNAYTQTGLATTLIIMKNSLLLFFGIVAFFIAISLLACLTVNIFRIFARKM